MRPRLFAALLLAAAGGPLAAAPAAKGADKADPSAADAIRKALDSTGNFEFADVTLAAVLDTLSEQYKVHITLDRAVIQQMGFEPEAMQVKLQMKNGRIIVGEALSSFRGVLTGVPTYIGSERTLGGKDVTER